MSESHSTPPVGRRRFLRVSGLVVGLLAVAPVASAFGRFAAPPDLEVDGKRYRGTADGRIAVSTDGGRTWTEIAYFGGAIRIEALTSNGPGTVKAHLRDSRRRFWVQSNDDRTWLTANYRVPSVA
jgi:hypothetical protein